MSLFDKKVIDIRRVINPMGAMPAEQLMRSVDRIPSSVPGGGGGSSIKLPFLIQDTSPDDTAAVINVYFGTVEDFSPTDISTDLTLTNDVITVVYLDATIDTDGLVTAVTLTTTSGVMPADTFDHAYKLVGNVTVADNVITLIEQSLYFSQGFASCGRDVEDPETTPGVYYFFVA